MLKRPILKILDEFCTSLTNRHVLQGASTINLRLSSGTQYAGRLSAVHDSLDIAYLDFNAGIPLAPIAVGDSDTVRVGDEVLVIGFPLASELGQEPTVSRGIVSARRGGLLQTCAPVNPGNSGGPMLDQFGNVVGVITSRVDTSESGRPVTGIGFAIPINDVTTGRNVPEPTTGRILPTPTPFPAIGATSRPRGHQSGPGRPRRTAADYRGPTPIGRPSNPYRAGSRPGSRTVRCVTGGYTGCRVAYTHPATDAYPRTNGYSHSHPYSAPGIILPGVGSHGA